MKEGASPEVLKARESRGKPRVGRVRGSGPCRGVIERPGGSRHDTPSPLYPSPGPLSFSIYFPSFSLLSDSLYFRPATFPPPALVSDSRSIFRHVLTLRCTVYRHMYLAYSGLTFKSILLIVISHYDITRSPC